MELKCFLDKATVPFFSLPILGQGLLYAQNMHSLINGVVRWQHATQWILSVISAVQISEVSAWLMELYAAWPSVEDTLQEMDKSLRRSMQAPVSLGPHASLM